MNVNRARTETETKTESTTPDRRPTGVSEHDDDHLPRKYVDEHEAMIRAIEKGDAERCDELAAQHAAQIVRQIQSYIARDVTATMRLNDRPSPPRRSRSA